MIKFIMCARRRSNLSRAEFQDYWINHHGPLFRRYSDVYKAVRYVQSHTISTPLNDTIRSARGMTEEYDGVGEIWWESERDFLEAISSPEGQKLRTIFLEDERRFVDSARSAAFFTQEHVLLNRTPRT